MVIDTHTWKNNKYKIKGLVIVYSLLVLTLTPVIVIIIIINYVDIVGYVDQLSRFLQLIIDRILTNLSS